MNIRELTKLLSQFDPETEIKIEVRYGNGPVTPDEINIEVVQDIVGTILHATTFKLVKVIGKLECITIGRYAPLNK